MVLNRTIQLWSATLMTGALAASPALALDASRFAEKFAASMEASGYVVDIAGIEQDGTTIILSGLTAIMTTPGSEASFSGSFTFQGVSELETGSYRAARMLAPVVDFTMTYGPATVPATATSKLPGTERPHAMSDDGEVLEEMLGGDQDDPFSFMPEPQSLSLLIRDIDATDVVVSGSETYDFGEAMRGYRSLTTGRIDISTGPLQIATIGSVDYAVSHTPDALDLPLTSMSYVSDANDIAIDLSFVDDPETEAFFRFIGGKQLTGSARQTGTWNLETGQFSLDENSFTLDGLGSVDFAFALGGLSGPVVAQLIALQAADPEMFDMHGDGDPKAALEVLEMMQDLSFDGLTFRIDDDGAALKVMQSIAEKENLTVDQVQLLAVASAPLAVRELELPAFSDEILEAVQAFLIDPQSFEIAVIPTDPLPLMALAFLGTGEPDLILSLLGVTISANDTVYASTISENE